MLGQGGRQPGRGDPGPRLSWGSAPSLPREGRAAFPEGRPNRALGSHGARGAATRAVPLAVPVSRPSPGPCAAPRGHLAAAPEPFHGWTGVCIRTHGRQPGASCLGTASLYNGEGFLGKAAVLDFAVKIVMLSAPG